MHPSSNHLKVVTVPEALEILRVGRTRFYDLLNTGQISAIRLGRRTLVRVDEIDRFIQALDAYQPRAQKRELDKGLDRVQQLKLKGTKLHA